MQANGLLVALLRWPQYSVLGCYLLITFCCQHTATASTPNDLTTLNACFAQHQLWSAAINQSEAVLTQQSLQRVSRRGSTLTLHLKPKNIQLTDRCDEQVIVRYRLVDIRHQIDHWVIEEATPQGRRYLLIEPKARDSQQWVVDSLPIFSEDSHFFGLFEVHLQPDTLETKLVLYRKDQQGWTRDVEQWRIQPCFVCHLEQDRQPFWQGKQIWIPPPVTAEGLHGIRSAQWNEATQHWSLDEF